MLLRCCSNNHDNNKETGNAIKRENLVHQYRVLFVVKENCGQGEEYGIHMEK